jgi:hypothetical protein
MNDEDRQLVKIFMDAQATPEGEPFSENVLRGLKAVLAFTRLERDTLKPLNLSGRIKLMERIAKSVNGMNAKQIIMYALEVRDTVK